MAASAKVDYSTCFEYCEDGFPKGYHYLVTERKKERTELRIREVVDEQSAREWLSKLNKTDSTFWRVQRTYPREKFLKTVMFRQDMRCQHNTDKRYISGQKRTKNTDCAVTMSVIVKRTNVRYSRAKDSDPLLKEWPCVIKINGEHNHPLFNVPAETDDVELDEETKQKLRHHFSRGHSVATALHMFKHQLLLDNPEVTETTHLLPSLSSCRRLFNSEFKQHSDDRPAEQLVEDLRSLTDSYEALLRVTSDGHHVIFFCSPLMRRVHELIAEASQIVFVDVYGGLTSDDERRLYTLTAVTAAGCLPLGIIITETDSEGLFEAALPTFTEECLPPGKFFSHSHPEVIVTNYKFKEKKALLNHFPNSHHLVCQVGVLRDAWNWLSDVNEDIGKSDRQEMFWCLKVLMYSQSDTQFNDNFEEVMGSVMLDNYPGFRVYLTELCKRKHEWATCYRLGLSFIEHGMNECANEMGAQLLREVMETRIMSFDLLQLFDFVATIYDSRIAQMLLAYTNGDVGLKFLPALEEVPVDHISRHREPDIFFVKNGNQKRWKVDLSRFVCTCPLGNEVECCTHTKAAMIFDHLVPSSGVNSFDRTQFLLTLMQVATGIIADSTNCLYSIKSINHSTELPSETVSFSLKSAADINNDPDDDHSDGDALLAELGTFVERIITGVKERPKEFCPALKSMLNNLKMRASTEKDLLAVMNAFGEDNVQSEESGQCSKVLVNVQPVSIFSCQNSNSLIGGPTENEISLKVSDHDYSLPNNCVQLGKSADNFDESNYENDSPDAKRVKITI